MLLLTADEDSRKAARANEVLLSCFEATSMSQSAVALGGEKDKAESKQKRPQNKALIWESQTALPIMFPKKRMGLTGQMYRLICSPFINSWYRVGGKHSVIGG